MALSSLCGLRRLRVTILEESLEIYRQRVTANAASNLAPAQLALGQYDAAAKNLQAAHDYYRAHGQPAQAANTAPAHCSKTSAACRTFTAQQGCTSAPP